MVSSSEVLVVTTLAALRPPCFNRASSPKACPASRVLTVLTAVSVNTLIDTPPAQNNVGYKRCTVARLCQYIRT